MTSGDERRVGGAAGGAGAIRPIHAGRHSGAVRDTKSDADEDRGGRRRRPPMPASDTAESNASPASAQSKNDCDINVQGSLDIEHPATALSPEAATIDVLHALAQRDGHTLGAPGTSTLVRYSETYSESASQRVVTAPVIDAESTSHRTDGFKKTHSD
ncbi:MAG: hypothetical protein ACK4IT_01420 [Thioalkalivibrionaceae bacterium]